MQCSGIKLVHRTHPKCYPIPYIVHYFLTRALWALAKPSALATVYRDLIGWYRECQLSVPRVWGMANLLLDSNLII